MKKSSDIRYVDCGNYYEMHFPSGGIGFIDKSRYSWVKDFHWVISSLGYVCCSTCSDGKRHNVLLHRYILLAEKGQEVDHCDHNPLNNKLSNLRICTRQQNQRNKKLTKTNTSGTPGISLNKSGTWTAFIGVKGKTVYLGSFKNKEDAIKARHQAEDKYFGCFSYRNSMSCAGV